MVFCIDKTIVETGYDPSVSGLTAKEEVLMNSEQARERLAELSEVLEKYCQYPHAAAKELVELGYCKVPELKVLSDHELKWGLNAGDYHISDLRKGAQAQLEAIKRQYAAT